MRFCRRRRYASARPSALASIVGTSASILHAFAQFVFQRRAFLLAHLLEFVERLVQRAVQCVDYSRRFRYGQVTAGASEQVDIQFTCDIEVLLQLLQRVV